MKHDNTNVIPFLWLNKESREDIIKEIDYIKSIGINAIMVESRVHENFCGEKWFNEMDVIMECARKNEMKVWLLDDKSYPSGYANGIFEKKYPQLRAHFIIAKKTDVVGERKNVKFIVNLCEDYDETLIGAFLCKRNSVDCYSEIKDITRNVHGEFLYADIPDGEYSVITLIETTKYEEKHFYLDMLSADSVDKFIEEVYQKHYDRYSDLFGTTFMGFFSDEPRFANGRYLNSVNFKYNIRSIMGEFGTAYPFSKQVKKSFNKLSDILALWFNIGKKTAFIRCNYMELITDIMSRNFSGKLSAWCNKRKIHYAGHIIEDNGNHASLGCSLGHYFKSQKGADMASVDIVLHQIKPYDNDIPHFGPIAGAYGYPEFFNYTLLKLASSCARLDKKKKGRALCEIFGAYGWGETTDDMLYLVNTCLSQGINRFIPHAFTHVFNLKDCPPHFYFGGEKSINEHHKALFGYMSKMSEKFDGGDAETEYAVLYHAQMEWSGNDYTAIDGIMKYLSDRQIGADIVDFGHLKNAENSEDGLKICGRKYKKLICPFFKDLPNGYIKTLKRFENNIIYADKDNVNLTELLLKEKEVVNIGLHILDYHKNGESYTFVFNGGRKTVGLDNLKNYKYAVDYVLGYAFKIGKSFAINKGQAFVLQNYTDGLPLVPKLKELGKVNEFGIYIKAFNQKNFVAYKTCVDLNFDINAFENIPDFSGVVKYTFNMNNIIADYALIEYDGDGMIFDAQDGRKISIGGKALIKLSDKEKKANKIELELQNSFAYTFRDRYSEFNYIAPAKINRVSLYKKI